jgi:hypothetical protein
VGSVFALAQIRFSSIKPVLRSLLRPKNHESTRWRISRAVGSARPRQKGRADLSPGLPGRASGLPEPEAVSQPSNWSGAVLAASLFVSTRYRPLCVNRLPGGHGALRWRKLGDENTRVGEEEPPVLNSPVAARLLARSHEHAAKQYTQRRRRPRTPPTGRRELWRQMPWRPPRAELQLRRFATKAAHVPSLDPAGPPGKRALH